VKPSPRFARRRPGADERLVERLREICLALPEANEKVSHGEPTWFAGKGKVFAMLDDHHHGSPHLSVWLPQSLGTQETLIAADAERFFRPPYVGVRGWVGVVLDTKPDWRLVAELVRSAYLRVATRRLAAQLEALAASGPRAARAPARQPKRR
jgi:predicted DNA-binding protein (MmcQ/YjbR family)